MAKFRRGDPCRI